MSSTAYFAEIRPDPALRRVVLASGAALALAGIPLIVTLPMRPEFRAAAVIVWLALAVHELARSRRGWIVCHALRFSADGTVDVLMPGQNWQRASLMSGGILLRRLGWIRLAVMLPTGRKIVLGEFLRGDCRQSVDWRRLQVIWRHVGA